MLRFIEVLSTKTDVTPLFQYIPCYGLSDYDRAPPDGNVDFNTSHVTVYRNHWRYIYGQNEISIHPMLRFIKRY